MTHEEEIKEGIKEIKEQLIRMNGRVRSVENWRWFLAGMGAVLSIIIIPIVLILIEKSL